MSQGKFIDLTGMEFERLKVIKRANDHIQPNGSKVVMWECECKCGNKTIVSGRNLRSRCTRSCGCLKEEIINNGGTSWKRYNKYDLSQSFGVGYLTNGKTFLFDLEDYDKIKNYCWSTGSKGTLFSYDVNTKKRTSLKRLIMNVPENMLINYKNHNPLDNRKKNLIIVTPTENRWGSNINKNNTSGVTGVCFNKRENKWQAYICVKRKNMYLGMYKNKEDAIKARKIAEEKYFGEYSYDNRMKGDEK